MLDKNKVEMEQMKKTFEERLKEAGESVSIIWGNCITVGCIYHYLKWL